MPALDKFANKPDVSVPIDASNYAISDSNITMSNYTPRHTDVIISTGDTTFGVVDRFHELEEKVRQLEIIVQSMGGPGVASLKWMMDEFRNIHQSELAKLLDESIKNVDNIIKGMAKKAVQEEMGRVELLFD